MQEEKKKMWRRSVSGNLHRVSAEGDSSISPPKASPFAQDDVFFVDFVSPFNAEQPSPSKRRRRFLDFIREADFIHEVDFIAEGDFTAPCGGERWRNL